MTRSGLEPKIYSTRGEHANHKMFLKLYLKHIWYTMLPRFIAPRYNSKLAYRHDFLKSRFIYVIMPTSHIAIRQTIYFPSLIMPNCLITFIKIHNWLLSELNQYTCHSTWFLCVYFVTWSYDVNPVIRVYLDRFCN
jgi:hypothetical protein